MPSTLERIYGKLPAALQNTAVSVVGWSLNRKRYAPSFRRHVDALMRSQWLTREQFHRYQTAALRDLLREVITHVPHYRETLRKHASRIDTFDLSSLRELPILEKQTLRARLSEFVNESRRKLPSEQGHTSGTTGSPMVWDYDAESMQYNLAFRERQYYWAGVSRRCRSGRFGGRVFLGQRSGPPYWRYNAAESQWLFSSYHISTATIPYYYQAFRENELQFLDGYPSSLYSVAQWVNEQGLSGQWRPWAIFTTAEPLVDYQRAAIEQAFGCRVYNFYSSSEGAPFVTQSPAGTLLLNPESGIIEFLRADGSHAEPGEDAELVVTSFFQRSIPLIRYRIGDTGALAEQQASPCGRHMPVVKWIGGRATDVLESSTGGRLNSAGISTALCELPARIRESQIEQVAEDAFVFRYVRDKDPLNEVERKTISEVFYARLGRSIRLELCELHEIPRDPNGKFRQIIGLKSHRPASR